MGNPRRTNGTRRNKLREYWRRQELPCALCGKPIDYTLPYLHPMSYVLDEIIPVSKGGSPYTVENTQPAHRCCNARKGARMPDELIDNDGHNPRSEGRFRDPLPRSRDW